MTHTLIYPDRARHTAQGHLAIDGCDTVDLVAEFGTPLFVYSEAAIRDQCRRFMEAFRARTDDFEVIYASKAFSAIAIIQLVAEEGLSLDVSSGGELHTGLAAGFPAAHMFYHGNNKTRDELVYALDNGVGTVVVDSMSELEMLGRLAAERDVCQQVLLRITPGIEAHTHEYIQTGQEDSKFGFGLAEGIARDAIGRALAVPSLELAGLHAHIGSQIFQFEGYQKAIAILVDLIKEAHDTLGFQCRSLNIGGGLGIRYTEEDAPSSVGDYVDVKVRALREEMGRVGLPVPRILVEPGRSIVANAAVTAYRIGTIKEIPGIRTYVSVDGGMSDNLRPMLYGAKYEAMIANRADDPADTVVTVAGKHCESGDVLIHDAVIARPELGDILVTPATGAYCYAMASNYNGSPRPAVILVKEGQARMIIERETYSDLVRRQRPLHEA